jgi:hypothetical protein
MIGIINSFVVCTLIAVTAMDFIISVVRGCVFAKGIRGVDYQVRHVVEYILCQQIPDLIFYVKSINVNCVGSTSG